jgi:hypothetical protein
MAQYIAAMKNNNSKPINEASARLRHALNGNDKYYENEEEFQKMRKQVENYLNPTFIETNGELSSESINYTLSMDKAEYNRLVLPLAKREKVW